MLYLNKAVKEKDDDIRKNDIQKDDDIRKDDEV